MTNRFATALLLAGTVSIAACQKKAPEELPPPPIDETTTVDTGNQVTRPTVGTQEHFLQAVGAENTVIYFNTDEFNVDSEDASRLQIQGRYFSQNPGVTFTIEGHADERGTRDYNLALGERRANAAKNYLVSLGIPANRIQTISYGKERPIALDSTPAAWAQNRRAATVVINY